MAKLKVGDEVLIYDVSNIEFGSIYWNDGDIGMVTVVEEDGDVFLSSYKSPAGHFLITSEEYPFIRKLAKFKERDAKVGDEVIIVNIDAIRLGTKYWSQGEVTFINRLHPHRVWLSAPSFRFDSSVSSDELDFVVSPSEYGAIRRVRKVKGVKGS